MECSNGKYDTVATGSAIGDPTANPIVMDTIVEGEAVLLLKPNLRRRVILIQHLSAVPGCGLGFRSEFPVPDSWYNSQRSCLPTLRTVV